MTQIIDALVEDSLRELADEHLQTRLWQATEGPEISSFIEVMETLWGDSGLAVALDNGRVYNDVIDGHLRELHSVLRRIDPMAPDKAILASPHLAEARQRARLLLEELTQFGYDRGGPEL